MSDGNDRAESNRCSCNRSKAFAAKTIVYMRMILMRSDTIITKTTGLVGGWRQSGIEETNRKSIRSTALVVFVVLLLVDD